MENMELPDGVTVREMVKQYLAANGCDGLCNVDAECGCEADDLSPGDCLSTHCERAKKVPCRGGDDCPGDGDCDFHMVPFVGTLIEGPDGTGTITP